MKKKKLNIHSKWRLKLTILLCVWVYLIRVMTRTLNEFYLIEIIEFNCNFAFEWCVVFFPQYIPYNLLQYNNNKVLNTQTNINIIKHEQLLLRCIINILYYNILNRRFMDSIMIQHMRIYRWYVCKCIQIHTVYRTIMFEYGIGFETCVFLIENHWIAMCIE